MCYLFSNQYKTIYKDKKGGMWSALFLQILGKGPGPFKRGKFPKLGKKSHSERKIDNVLE